MSKTYELLEMAKARTGIDSDYGISEMMQVNRQMVSSWKHGKSEANAINTLKLIKAAGLTIDDALKIMTEAPAQKELNLSHSYKLAMSGYISMSLLFVTSSVCACLLALIFNINKMYIMLNGKLIKISKIKGQLRTLNSLEMQQLVASNDMEAGQVTASGFN